MTQLYKPVFKENDLTARESINRQFLNSFAELKNRKPRQSVETCDLHLNGDQPVLFADPKANASNEITWNEPKDLQNWFFTEFEQKSWLILSIIAFVFFLMVWYWWL